MSTKIEWTNVTVNPFPGCRKVSPGCANCYAEKMARRLKAMGQPQYQDVVNEKGWTGKVGASLKEHMGRDYFEVPGRGKMVFVNSMGDLFYEGVTDDQRDRVFASIARMHRTHTFQILTKRPERMRDYLMIQQRQVDAGKTFWWHDGRTHPKDGTKLGVFGLPKDWPLGNLWLGVTAENQEWADRRIPILLQIPAAVRFASLEPLLGPVNLCWCKLPAPPGYDYSMSAIHPRSDKKLDWVIVGPETGPGRRPCKLEWIESIVDQCHAAGVPVFVKAVPILGRPIHHPDIIAEALRCKVEDIRQFPKVSSSGPQ